jgi:trehalose/maltose hydrolase-like predicted phosphorylase
LMVFHPPIARNLLQNRLFQLPSYKSNAKAFGLKGAYVPWEVGYSGGFARCEKRHLFVCFSYVCPEPVLAKCSFL